MPLNTLRSTGSKPYFLQRSRVFITQVNRFRSRNLSSGSRKANLSAGSTKAETCNNLTTDQLSPKYNQLPSQNCDEESFYRYTSGRWLWKEKEQLSRRYVKFDVGELTRIAKQVTGSKSCIQVQKLPEGNFNKVFLIEMSNGKEVIAKLPNPNAGRAYFTTASEVATMDYVRNVLHIPAPKVYAWSHSTDNPVGAEYIIMERSGGVELGKIWDDLPGPEKYQITKKLVGFEKAFVSANFPMYGSLYYAKDLPGALSNQHTILESSENKAASSVFAIGPSTNRTFFDDGRDTVNPDLGPWSSVQDYILSRVHRELACVQKFSEFPHQQGLFYGPGQYRPSKKLKTDTLHHYIKVAPFLLPNDNTISKPVLWHPDLHGDNIFVNPSQPTDILAIIDWQSVNLSPLFLQARHPALIEFDGPATEGFQSINLPENFDKLSPSEQLEAKKLRAAQSLYKLYEIQLIRQCPDVARALRFRDSLAGQITGLAGSIFSDGEPTLQGMLMRLRQEWPACVSPSTPCPLSFSTEDENQQKKDEAKWREGVELMEEFLGQVGAYRGWDGWVNHQNFEVMKSRLSECREDFLTRHSATDEERRQFMKHWPFMDK